MKFTVSREDFLKPLQLVVGVVERRQTLPILSNVLIGLSDGIINYGWLMALLVFAGIILLRKVIHTPGGRFWWGKPPRWTVPER